MSLREKKYFSFPAELEIMALFMECIWFLKTPPSLGLLRFCIDIQNGEKSMSYCLISVLCGEREKVILVLPAN